MTILSLTQADQIQHHSAVVFSIIQQLYVVMQLANKAYL